MRSLPTLVSVSGRYGADAPFIYLACTCARTKGASSDAGGLANIGLLPHLVGNEDFRLEFDDFKLVLELRHLFSNLPHGAANVALLDGLELVDSSHAANLGGELCVTAICAELADLVLMCDGPGAPLESFH